MFDKDALIKMADGTHKKIGMINIGDYIVNKLNHSVKVNRVHKINTSDIIEIILDNDFPTFYTIPTTKFLFRNTDEGSHTSFYYKISDVDIKTSKLKSSMKIFSPESDITIDSYKIINKQIELYCLHISDSTFSFFINNCIVCCNEC